MHASAALEEGVDLLLGINPLVPFESDYDDDITARHKDWVANLVEGGLPMVLSQTFRAMIQSRIKVSLDKYSDRYENVDLLLIEPNRGDEDLFFTNIFSFSSRRKLVEHAYLSTRMQLRSRVDEMENLLAPYGYRLRKKLLFDDNHDLNDSLSRNPTYSSPVARRLGSALDELDEILEQRH